jgi:outer membrane protein assembly factor BamB
MRRFALHLSLVAIVALSACAMLANAGRPAYSGPDIPPLWHVSGVSISQTPVIAGDMVYAVGREQQSGQPRLFAFSLGDGKRLWSSIGNVARIAGVAGSVVIAVDDRKRAFALDARSGFPAHISLPESTQDIAYANGTLYALDSQSVHAYGPGTNSWRRALPIVLAPLILAATNIYVYGLRHTGDTTPNLTGVYALDARSGAVRWKYEWRDTFGKYGFDAHKQAMAWIVKPDKRDIDALVADHQAAYARAILTDENAFAYATNVIAFDAASGNIKWQHKTSGLCLDAPSLVEADKLLVCEGPRSPGSAGAVYELLRRSDGAVISKGETAWTYDYSRSISLGIEAIVADGRAHQVLNENNVTSPDSWLTLVNRSTGQESWRTNELTLGVLTVPATGSGIAVVGSAPFGYNDVHGSPDVAGLWAWRIAR